MEVAVAINYDAWITWNTALCHRLSARITETACENNRSKSTGENGDLRCAGCGGLHDQAAPIALQLVTVHPRLDLEETASETPEPSKADITAEPEPTSIDAEIGELNSLEIELTAAQLEELCPGLSQELSYLDNDEDDTGIDDDAWIELGYELVLKAKALEAKTGIRRFAVYMGRCRKCSGYMANAREHQFNHRDEDVFRCFNCGWRTSPKYKENRHEKGQGE